MCLGHILCLILLIMRFVIIASVNDQNHFFLGFYFESYFYLTFDFYLYFSAAYLNFAYLIL